MDWLEELAEKIKKKLSRANLRRSLIFYLLGGNTCRMGIVFIYNQYL